jgi:glycerol-3-phosphate dehydrogenase
MNRPAMLNRVLERSESGEPWDVIVIGGGATGAGVVARWRTGQRSGLGRRRSKEA